MDIKYQTTVRDCIIASNKCGQLTFQGAGKTKEEALQYMWTQYKRYYR